MVLKHTPYADGAGHFSIGLTPLEKDNWIEVDHDLPRYLDEKERLMGVIPERVFAADHSSEKAQAEVLELLVSHLVEKFPDVYSKAGSVVQVRGTRYEVDLDDFTKPPLLLAAMLVQEDLVLMRKTEAGWRLVAASVCFPSSWVLREKIGKVMHDIHEPVPGFHKGTRNAGMIERIFDNLLVDTPVERFNWSIYNDDALYHDDRISDHFLNQYSTGDDYFLRVEHQTLTKLPLSGDILFTIRIHIDPLKLLAKRSDKEQLGQQFAQTLREMSDEEMTYKGLDQHRDELIGLILGVTQGA